MSYVRYNACLHQQQLVHRLVHLNCDSCVHSSMYLTFHVGLTGNLSSLSDMFLHSYSEDDIWMSLATVYRWYLTTDGNLDFVCSVAGRRDNRTLLGDILGHLQHSLILVNSVIIFPSFLERVTLISLACSREVPPSSILYTDLLKEAQGNKHQWLIQWGTSLICKSGNTSWIDTARLT